MQNSPTMMDDKKIIWLSPIAAQTELMAQFFFTVIRYLMKHYLKLSKNLADVQHGAKTTWALAILLEHMHKKFEVNRTKIKGGRQLRTKAAPKESRNNLALAILLEHMHKKFEINWTKSKGGCQSGRKVVIHNSKGDLPLIRIWKHSGWLIIWQIWIYNLLVFQNDYSCLKNSNIFKSVCL